MAAISSPPRPFGDAAPVRSVREGQGGAAGLVVDIDDCTGPPAADGTEATVYERALGRLLPVHADPSQNCGAPSVILKMISPVAGEPIASHFVAVMRGGRKPRVVLDSSNSADAFGSEVPIPTLPSSRSGAGIKLS